MIFHVIGVEILTCEESLVCHMLIADLCFASTGVKFNTAPSLVLSLTCQQANKLQCVTSQQTSMCHKPTNFNVSGDVNT
jgi:hypothetical protein